MALMRCKQRKAHQSEHFLDQFTLTFSRINLIRLMVLLHFFGLGDGLRRFELEQLTGLNLMGFRPVTLDQLVIWSQEVAAQQRWDVERIHNDVVEIWMDQAEEINQWRHRLRQAPNDVQLLAGIGDLHSWQRHWEGMLRQTPPGNRA